MFQMIITLKQQIFLNLFYIMNTVIHFDVMNNVMFPCEFQNLAYAGDTIGQTGLMDDKVAIINHTDKGVDAVDNVA